MNTDNKIIKNGTVVNWRGSWGHAIEKKATITGIDFCEIEGYKYGVTVPEIWAKDKDRCVFTLDTGNWAYGHQIDLLPESLTEYK